MLQITIPATEQWDEARKEFISIKEQTLTLEHSLISLSKWESKWCKAFLTKQEKTYEETIDYIRCMTLTQNVDPNVYFCLTNENVKQINEYIEAPMTATVFYEDKNGKGGRETVTSELIYYWMIALTIPFDPCQKWHLNRLLTLIRVCNIKNTPPKKMSKSALASRNAALNASRKRQLGTKG
jgi:hypothetical protein